MMIGRNVGQPHTKKRLGRYAVYRTSMIERLIRHLRRTNDEKWQDMIYKKEEVDQLKNVVEKSQDTLLKVRAVFPFNLFPDTITIDRQKLTVVKRVFFKMEQTISVQLKDVKTVEADTGPFFGTVTISSQNFVNNVQTVNYLWRKDALKIQSMLQGAIIAAKEEIDISEVKKNDLIKMLNELGQGELSPT